MSKFRVPTEKEKKILLENGVDPEKTSLAVVFRTPTRIDVLIHRTRDTITIHKGDRPW